jgi:3-hydroxyacyl-CoA dehydrogenase / enoyl-CoA hydratase / 3-hydroxybutyryl-CoA epimerase
MSATQFFAIEHDADGIATLTWDLQDSPVNVFSEPAIDAFREAINALVDDPAVKGVVIASAKSVFHVGADLAMAQAMGGRTVDALYEGISGINAMFRKMETGGKPFVAAINGMALGGGFEMAMACHARFLGDGAKVELGLPEAKLGLMPGFGGTQRLPRLIPVDKAVPMMLLGTSVKPADALALGLVEAIVPEQELIAAAKKWILANPGAQQPWDKTGYKLPAGPIHSPKNFQFFIGASAQARKTTGGHYPAVTAILECVYHGLQLPMDPALRFEARRFVRIAHSSVSRAMIRTLFFGLNDANRLARKPEGFQTATIRTIGIVGAGLMGAGIAHDAARAGLNVVILDMDADAAAKGVDYSASDQAAITRSNQPREN